MTTQGYTCEQYVHVQFAVHFNKCKQPMKKMLLIFGMFPPCNIVIRPMFALLQFSVHFNKCKQPAENFGKANN